MRDNLCIAKRFSDTVRYIDDLLTLNNNKTEKTFKNEQRSKDAAAKKRPTTSGVGKINNYYEDIYIPPYNNTDSPHLYIVTIPIDSTH